MSLDISITVWCDGKTPKSQNIYGTCVEHIDGIFGTADVLVRTSNRINDQTEILNNQITDRMKKDEWVTHNEKVYCPGCAEQIN